jgi:antitoxin component YwqK of YwqJK toxin-antitoxin module
MKKIMAILLFFVSGAVCAQEMPDMTIKVRIVETGKTVVAEVNQVASLPSTKSNLFYYWYSANSIHSTQGGFSGKLLDGEYDEYYPDKGLKEQGLFKKGLKSGTWKDWNADGTLKAEANWKNGVLVNVNTVSFWKKINIFKRKPKQNRVDSLNKASK